MARVSKVRRSPQAVACGKRNAVELGKPRTVPDVGTARNGYTAIEARKGKPGHGTALESKTVGTARLWYTGIEAMTGKLENGTNLEPTTLPENHAPGGPETAIYPWGVLSGIVLGVWESHTHGEGPDGSTKPTKETRAGHAGLESHEPTSLRATALGRWPTRKRVQPKNRMRENCKSGSVPGAPGNWRPYGESYIRSTSCQVVRHGRIVPANANCRRNPDFYRRRLAHLVRRGTGGVL